MTSTDDLRPDVLARARLLHERSAVALSTIADGLGVSRHRLAAIVVREGWRRAGRDGPPASSDDGPLHATPLDRRAVALRLERFIAGRIAAHEAEFATGGAADPERLGRAVTSYARGLAAVRTYLADIEKEGADDDAGPPPRSLAELRDELERHLDRLRDQAGPRHGPGSAGPLEG